MTTKHKTRKRFHEPGDVRELTFSCYQGRDLLVDDHRCEMFATALQNALGNYQLWLVAYVLMPNHVHLLLAPQTHDPNISGFLFASKRTFSYRVKVELQEKNDPLLQTLTVRERPGKTTFRFWQEGGGYDRNLSNPKSVHASIEYIHLNPVKAQLCEHIGDWKWSSARHYLQRSDAVEIPQVTCPMGLLDD